MDIGFEFTRLVPSKSIGIPVRILGLRSFIRAGASKQANRRKECLFEACHGAGPWHRITRIREYPNEDH